jgi:L-cysteine desulfidase
MSIESDHRNELLLSILLKEIAPTFGCTDPIAVAYSAAVARRALGGTIRGIVVSVDPGLYKNALHVAIPGSSLRGLHMAAALGYIAGNPDKAYRVIEGASDEDVRRARVLVENGLITVRTEDRCDSLYIETILETDLGVQRVVTVDKYLNAIAVERGRDIELSNDAAKNVGSGIASVIQEFELNEFVEFADSVSPSDVNIVEQGIKMNSCIAAKGLESEASIGHRLSVLIKQGTLGDSMATQAQVLCCAAAEARMSGCRMPVMSTAGSGNHGITVFLTCVAAANVLQSPREQLVRSLVLANLVTVAIKSYTGTLSPMCGCGVAASVGASVGVVYLLGGSRSAMLGAMMNMIGSIAGVVCDGAKEGCALKLALASGWAVQSALLAVSGAVLPSNDGIVSPDMKHLFANLGNLCRNGMSQTNRTIIEIMQGSDADRQTTADW